MVAEGEQDFMLLLYALRPDTIKLFVAIIPQAHWEERGFVLLTTISYGAMAVYIYIYHDKAIITIITTTTIIIIIYWSMHVLTYMHIHVR